MATTTKPDRKQTSDKPTTLSESISDKRFWRDTAPEGVLGDNAFATWSRHLKKRRTPRSLEKLCEVNESPLGWGIALAELSPRTVEMLALHYQLCADARVSDETIEQILAGWLEGSKELPHSLDFALESLVVAHALPRISEAVLSEFWWALVDGLWQIVQSASSWRSDAELPAEQGVSQQILAGELPFTLACLFPEIKPLAKLRSRAQEALTEGISELTNGNGLVQGEYLGYLRPLLACWTRCRILGGQLKKGAWSRKIDEQFQWMVTHSLGLSSPTGIALLGGPHSEAWTPEFLNAVLQNGGDKADASAACSMFSKKLCAGIQSLANNTEPETSDNCEWAGVAYMRTSWDRKAPVVAVDYSAPELQLECWLGTQRLFHGPWSWETTVGGKRLEPVGSWDETCWFSDEDVDYLELSLDLTGGARLERQILLARDEMFLLLSDYFLDTAGGKLFHRFRLPLDGDVEFQPEDETREGVLASGKTFGRVLPLALPEWRVDPRIGNLTASNGRLQLEQTQEGKNIACPLLIDLKPTRAKKECTWRQLTVAQSLEIQSHDVAVGYRAQCGKDQWLIYRSLAESANRTLLGQNLSCECLIARFLAPDGEVDELLEIE